MLDTYLSLRLCAWLRIAFAWLRIASSIVSCSDVGLNTQIGRAYKLAMPKLHHIVHTGILTPEQLEIGFLVDT